MKKIWFFLKYLQVFLCLILILKWINYEHKKAITTEIQKLSESFETKNIKLFKNTIDSKKISEEIVEAYKISNDKKEDSLNESDETLRMLKSIKSNLLGALYDAFSNDIEKMIYQFFDKEPLYSMVYDNEEIEKNLNNLDFKKIKIELEDYQFYKNPKEYIVSILIYNNLIKENLKIKLKLENVGWPIFVFNWKITNLVNFEDSLRQYVELKEKRINFINEDIKNKIDSLVLLEQYETKTFSYFENFGNSTKHKIKVKNISKENIDSIKIKIWVKTFEGQMVEKIVEDRRGIEPKQTIEIKVTDFDPNFNYEMIFNKNYPKMEIIEVLSNKEVYKYISEL